MTHAVADKIPSRAIWIWALFTLELIAIIVAFQVLASVECRQTSIEFACRGLRGMAVRTFCFGAMLGIYLWARSQARREFSDIVAERTGGRIWVVMHLLGLGVIFTPLLIIAPTQMNASFGMVFPVLIVGAILTSVGGIFWLAAPSRLAAWLRERWMELLLLTASAMMLPDLAAILIMALTQ